MLFHSKPKLAAIVDFNNTSYKVGQVFYTSRGAFEVCAIRGEFRNNDWIKQIWIKKIC